MKNFWTALLLLTLIAIAIKITMLFSFVLFYDYFLFVNAPLNIVILLYIIKKFYYDRTEEPNKRIRSIILFVITWLISFIAAAISGFFIIAWLISALNLR